MVNKSVAPVFLVGASRCGNTLLQEALSGHPNIHISSETHWFDDERCQRNTAIADEAERAETQSWFMSLAHLPFGHSGDPAKGWLDRNTLEHEALCVAARGDVAKPAIAGTRDNYFHAYCKLDAERHGKQRWGEKTPRHVFRINDILQAFPDAKVVCSLRDPRAMVASYRQWSVRKSHDLYTDNNNDDLAREKKRSADSYHPVIAALLWRGAARAALQAIDQHGSERVKIVQYEAIVTEPQATLRQTAEWLGELFEPAMLDVPLINSSFDEFKAGAGFQTQAIHRWKKKLSRSERAVIRLLCRREMMELGYQGDDEQSALWPLYALPKLATLPVAVHRAWKANRDRTGNIFLYIWRRISV